MTMANQKVFNGIQLYLEVLSEFSTNQPAPGLNNKFSCISNSLVKGFPTFAQKTQNWVSWFHHYLGCDISDLGKVLAALLALIWM